MWSLYHTSELSTLQVVERVHFRKHVTGARTYPVEKTLERYNDPIPILNFSFISQYFACAFLPGTGTSVLPVEFQVSTGVQ